MTDLYNRKRKLISLFILLGVTGVSCLYIFRGFIFGVSLVAFNDSGSDTRQQYLMQYASIANHIRNGNFSFWNMNLGFGASMFALNPTNIFLMLIYFAGSVIGVGHIPGMIVYLLILQILLAALFCYFFLDSFEFSEQSKIIASYIYALNGYMLIWGQHYQFGSFVVFLPLLLLLLERAIQKRKISFGASVLIAVMICASVYMSYMSLILTGCYLIFRLVLVDGPIRDRISLFFRHCGMMILGIAMGAVIFMPMVYFLLTISTRLNSNIPFFRKMLNYCSLFPLEFYKTAFIRLFSTTFQGLQQYRGYSNLYEAPVFFFSALFVILFFQYLFTIHRQEVSVKSKVMQYAAVLFFVFCMLIRLGACIFNAFAYPFSRHSFLFMPLFAVLVAFTLDQIWLKKKFSFVAMLFSLAAIFYAHRTGWLQAGEVQLQKHVLVMGILTIVMLILVCAGYYLKTERITLHQLFAAVLLFLVMLNVSREGFLCYNDRNLLTTQDPEYWGGLYDPDVTEALNFIYESEDSLYRVEKDYNNGSFCMDGLAQDYRGISAYNSTPNKNIEEFVNLVIPNFPIMATYEYTWRQIGNYTGHSTLFGIKYILSKNPKLELSGFSLLKQCGGVYIYQNENCDSFARFYTQAGDSSILNKSYGVLDLEDLLLNVALLDLSANTHTASVTEELLNGTILSEETLSEKYALESLPIVLDNIIADGSSDTVRIPLDQSVIDNYDRLYLEFDIKTPKDTDITVNIDRPLEYHFRNYGGKTKHVQLAIPKSYKDITMTRYGANLYGEITNLQLLGVYESKTENSSSALVHVNNTNNDSHITGTIQTEENGFLFLPIPYEAGWTATIDGEKTDLLRTNVGFVSIPVTAGEHTFTFDYEQPYMRVGIYVTIIAWGIWLILLIHTKRKK